jgi:hypothetical protein
MPVGKEYTEMNILIYLVRGHFFKPLNPQYGVKEYKNMSSDAQVFVTTHYEVLWVKIKLCL